MIAKYVWVWGLVLAVWLASALKAPLLTRGIGQDGEEESSHAGYADLIREWKKVCLLASSSSGVPAELWLTMPQVGKRNWTKFPK